MTEAAAASPITSQATSGAGPLTVVATRIAAAVPASPDAITIRSPYRSAAAPQAMRVPSSPSDGAATTTAAPVNVSPPGRTVEVERSSGTNAGRP